MAITVYNFRVADVHTYFVREAGSQAEPVWVHNQCGASGRQLSLFDEEAAALRSGKTVATDALGRQTVSGWKDVRGFQPSSRLVPQVMAVADEIGYEFEPHLFDQGVPGRYNASHADTQMSLFSDEFEISQTPCESCRSFLSARAMVDGRTRVVSDPSTVWTFGPTYSSWTPR